MELLLSAISTGGLSGAADQYLCLIIISVAARFDLVSVAHPVAFIESWWFIGIVAVFWVLTTLPAYGSLLSPGVMNAVNTVVNLLSGFVVPASAALLTLASVGVIAEMNPELYDVLQTLQIFDPSGQSVGAAGWLMAGGGALTASALTGAKFLAKPAVSATTGTAGHISAPAYATLENVAAVILMALAYVLTRINPWLLVGLLALIVLIIVVVLAWAVYQLWKLGKGVGRVIRLIETRPRAGLAVVAESLVWGSGWLIWKNWNRGLVRLALWGLWVALVFVGIPAIGTALGAALVVTPPLAFLATALALSLEAAAVMVGLFVGARSARSLMETFDDPILGMTPSAPVLA
ncbi:MAG: hypothetical protein DRJ03_16795 [Chloroflexi bacterium]|nr:MAG: hypothetical protein DRI81_05090 [Chloroflexota bacterium]RLC83564.1 MAG: hypothetical protein DRJ03_16795 [Chloroflexota bacterium]